MSEAARPVAAGPPFVMTEYGTVEWAFIAEAIDEVARRGDPILSVIRVEPTAGRVVSQITTDGGAQIELPSEEIRLTVELSAGEIASGRPGPLVAQIAAAAEEKRKALLTHLFTTIDRVTEATGNVVSAEGRPFIDAFCEMLEGMELAFDENGQLAPGYRIVVHPETNARIQAQIAASTPEERVGMQARVDAVLDRKGKEFRARQRRRRLS